MNANDTVLNNTKHKHILYKLHGSTVLYDYIAKDHISNAYNISYKFS